MTPRARIIGIATVLSLSVISMCQAQSPTDIYLMNLSVRRNRVFISEPVAIAKHKGYDNQPCFHPEKPLIYFSSADESGRTNILDYNYVSGQTRNITITPEREYSPTVTPDGKFLSCIIQRDGGAQDLGKYPLEGDDPKLIVDSLIVGYHVWVDPSNLILFVLGNVNTLQWYNIDSKTHQVLIENPGRSLHKIPGKNAVSFVHKVSETEWLIKSINLSDRVITTLCPTLPDREDLAWTADGKILMSDGTKLFSVNPFGTRKTWHEVDSPFILSGVTRLAVHPDGSRLALVMEEK